MLVTRAELERWLQALVDNNGPGSIGGFWVREGVWAVRVEVRFRARDCFRPLRQARICKAIHHQLGTHGPAGIVHQVVGSYWPLWARRVAAWVQRMLGTAGPEAE